MDTFENGASEHRLSCVELPRALEAALEPDRFEYLCEHVTARCSLATAGDVLELMGAATRLRPLPPTPAPVERAVARLGAILELDLEPATIAPYDWAVSGA